MLAALAVFSCATPALAEGLPDLGESSQNELPPQMERRIGEEAMTEIRLRESTYVDDAEISGYLTRLVGRMAVHLEGVRPNFEVFALRDPTLNAFAMPGGFIGVHTGLILAAQSESELASVLAHEMSHVTQHHLARSIAPQQQAQTAAMLAMAVAILAARNRPDLAMGAVASGQAAAVQSQLSYSRDFEREADRMGLALLERSGFDIRGMGDFFGRMEQFGRVYENNAPAYLRTHPLTTERITDMGNRIQTRPYRQVVDSLDFLLVRAKLRAQLGTPDDAVADFSALLVEGKYRSEIPVRYGLARAYLRANNLPAAEKQLQALGHLKVGNTMVETLAAEVAQKAGDVPGAVRILRAAYGRAPQERAVSYALIDLLLDTRQPEEAARLLRDELQSYTTDEKLYLMLGRAEEAMGHRFRQHSATAQAYVLRGQVTAAVEQLELAQKAPDGDFYEHSQVDAKLRELKAQLIAEERNRRR